MRMSLFGLPIDLLTMSETVDRAVALARNGEPHQHVALNAAKVVAAQKDRHLSEIICSCSMVSADGMAVVWAGRLLGVPVPERVTGIDLMHELFERAAREGLSVYLLGARPEVVERVVGIIARQYPKLRIAGYEHGHWAEDEEPAVVRRVAEAGADLLFVAMPSPRKERFLQTHLDQLGVGFAMGVGGSFDVIAGVTTRAPLWMQRSGLEWLHRLIQEPRRMAKRYAVGNTVFILLTLRYLLRRLVPGRN